MFFGVFFPLSLWLWGNKEAVTFGLSAFDSLTSNKIARKLKKIIKFRFLKGSDGLITLKLKCMKCKVYACVLEERNIKVFDKIANVIALLMLI